MPIGLNLFVNLEQTDVLGTDLALRQRRDHRRARLRDVEALQLVVLGPDAAFMLVAPNDQVEKFGQETLF